MNFFDIKLTFLKINRSHTQENLCIKQQNLVQNADSWVPGISRTWPGNCISNELLGDYDTDGPRRTLRNAALCLARLLGESSEGLHFALSCVQTAERDGEPLGPTRGPGSFTITPE